MTIYKLPLAFLLANTLVAETNAAGDATIDQQLPPTKWDVSLPEIVASEDHAAEPVPAALNFAGPVVSHSFSKNVTEAAPMDGLPPVSGKIRVTLQVVEAPKNYFPSPLPPEPVTPLIQESSRPISDSSSDTQTAHLVFVSATVYDSTRTLLRISTSEVSGDEVQAWSNINFNVFRAINGFQVRKGNGTVNDCSLIMGIGDESTEAAQATATLAGIEYSPPQIPPLPELSVSGPVFQLVAGSAGSSMESLEQIHDLFRKDGEQISSDYEAFKQAEDERRAELLANPPKPADVVIRYWKGDANLRPQEVAK